MSCFIGQPLASRALHGDCGALHVIDAKPNAVVHSEIKFGQIAVKVLGIDVLIDADKPALEDREKALKSVGVHVAARPFEFGMINALMFREALEFVMLLPQPRVR